VAAEAGAGRLVPWLVVAFGFGIVVYFAAPREPALWAPPAALLAFLSLALVLRARPVGFTLLILLAAASAGFAAVTLKTAALAHPVLRHGAFGVTVRGWVEAREERERTDRITLAVQTLEGRRVDPAPDRVRISVRKGTAPAVGSFVQIKARLSPPLAPLRPGGYDFARDLYFQGIGATGFAQGRIEHLPAPGAPPALAAALSRGDRRHP
jgi:competence protein ComEC